MSTIAEGDNMLRDIMARIAPAFFNRRPKLVPLFGDVLSTRAEMSLIVAERWPALVNSFNEATHGWRSVGALGEWLKVHFPDEDWGPMAIHYGPQALRKYQGRVDFSEPENGR